MYTHCTQQFYLLVTSANSNQPGMMPQVKQQIALTLQNGSKAVPSLYLDMIEKTMLLFQTSWIDSCTVLQYIVSILVSRPH